MRRLISLLSRYSGLVDQIFFQWRSGSGEGQQILGGIAEHGFDLGKLATEHAAMTLSWECTYSASGWAKTVRTDTTGAGALRDHVPREETDAPPAHVPSPRPA